jgi:hypothetical protein
MKRFFIILALNSLSLKSAFPLVLNLHSGNGKNPREESDHGLQNALENASGFELASDIAPEDPHPDISNFEFWKHVGKVGMGSGIYLGDGFVLTSAHVGCYPFQIFDGSYYRPDYKSWKILQLEDGTPSDLAIFRVKIPDSGSALAKLGTLPVSNNAPRVDDAILMIGTGFDQNAVPATMSSNGEILAVLGYHVEPRRATRGGFNRIHEIPADPVKTGERRTHCFTTKFDRGVFEAQAADGDSGGATFVYDPESGGWSLAGCIVAVSQKKAFVPFGSLTFLADLSRYRHQISSVVSGTAGPGSIASTEPSPTGAEPGTEHPEPQMVKIPTQETEAVAEGGDYVPM